MPNLDPATIRACEAVVLRHRRVFERHKVLGTCLALQHVSRDLVRLREQAEIEQALTPEPAPVGIYTQKALDLQAGVRRMRRAS